MKHNYIQDSKNSLQEEFIEKYNHPFFISFVESMSTDPEKKILSSDSAIKSLNELVKSETKAQNNEVIDVIPVVKTKKNNEEYITIGRIESQDIFIDDLSISKLHAYLQLVDNKYLITDNNSTNGTVLNGLKLSANVQNNIKDQDKVLFGNIRYTFFSARSAYMFLKKQK